MEAAKEHLTQQEIRVLTLIAKGLSYEEVSQELGITFSTVRNHLTSIVDTLDAKNPRHAVYIAASTGLLPKPAGIDPQEVAQHV